MIVDNTGEYTYKHPYSDETAKMIDAEARKLVTACYERTLNLLRGKRKELESLAKELLEKEIIYKEDIERLVGERTSEEPELRDKPEYIDILNTGKVNPENGNVG